MKGFQLSLLIGLLLVLGLLTGCALFPPTSPVDEEGLSGSSGWVIAAQGAEEPRVCAEDLSRREVRQEVKETLGEEEEAQALQQALASLGKRVMVWRAQGCTVQEDEGALEGQGLRALADEEETALVEVPAGRDAALYMVESGDEGNYWVSLREQAEGGERLVHLEVGLESEGDAEVQGLGEDMGQVSLFLPDEEGTQEIAGQVQELLQEDPGAEGEGLKAMALEGELDWSKAEVVLLDEDSEEAEALLVVPPAEAEGQRVLWGRGYRFDENRALYANVTLKRIASQSKKRPSYKIVKTKPIQIKRGDELTAKPFKFCPYRYYGRLSVFRKPLCHYWKRRAASKVQKFTLNRAIRSLPSIHKQMTATAEQSPKIMGIVGKERGLLMYNAKNLSPDELLKLFNSTANGAAALSTEGQVEGEQLFELLSIFLDFVKDLVQQWQRMSEEERNAFIRALSLIQGSADPMAAAVDYYGRTSPEGQAYTKVVDSIIRALRQHLGLSQEEAKAEALHIMGVFVSTLKASSKPGLMTDIVTHAGPAGIIAFVRLLEPQLLQYVQQNMHDGRV